MKLNTIKRQKTLKPAWWTTTFTILQKSFISYNYIIRTICFVWIKNITMFEVSVLKRFRLFFGMLFLDSKKGKDYRQINNEQKRPSYLKGINKTNLCLWCHVNNGWVNKLMILFKKYIGTLKAYGAESQGNLDKLYKQILTPTGMVRNTTQNLKRITPTV